MSAQTLERPKPASKIARKRGTTSWWIHAVDASGWLKRRAALSDHYIARGHQTFVVSRISGGRIATLSAVRPASPTAPEPAVVAAYRHEFAGRAPDSVHELLATLSGSFGMAWSDIAACVGVSVPAVRKWRQLGGASDENHLQLRTLAAFLSTAQSHGVVDPAGWFRRFLLDGYVLRPRDLYTLVGPEQTLLLAVAPTEVERFLDARITGWREQYATSFEVRQHDDGERTIGLRG